MTCVIAPGRVSGNDEKREFLLRLAEALGRSLANEDNELDPISLTGKSEVDAESE